MLDIHTNRLVIRNFMADDWRDLQAIAIDKAASEYAAYDHRFPTSEVDVKRIAIWFAGGDDFLAVCEASSNTLIGYIAINAEDAKARNFGYSFHSAYQKRGYAYEACVAVINYVFRDSGLERLTSGTANANGPSRRLLTRLGFRKTRESVTLLAETADGKAFEFVGSSYLLDRDEWAKQDYSVR